jgi:hypothetical protein
MTRVGKHAGNSQLYEGWKMREEERDRRLKG